MFQYREEDVVAIREDVPHLNLRAGTLGVVWAMYNTEPPSYEVTFWPNNDRPFDMTVSDEEVTATGRKSPVFERPVFEAEPVAA